MKPLPSRAELKPRRYGIGRCCPVYRILHDGITSVDKEAGVVWSVVAGDGSRNGLEWAWDGPGADSVTQANSTVCPQVI